MEKIKMNVIVDSIAFVFFLVSFVSGMVLFFGVPAVSGGGGFLGLRGYEWREVHSYSSILFSLMIFIHLLLHIQWITSIPKFIGMGKKQEPQKK